MASVPYGPPGQTFKYSDINFITLGALVEQFSGERRRLRSRRHLQPIFGMRSTGYTTHFYESYRTCGDSRPDPYGARQGCASTSFAQTILTEIGSCKAARLSVKPVV